MCLAKCRLYPIIFADAAFTERILGQPSVNYKAYVEADATQRAHHVPPHALYLLHGLADMSVPYPHALALARALTDAGVLFRYQVSYFLLALFHRGNNLFLG